MCHSTNGVERIHFREAYQMKQQKELNKVLEKHPDIYKSLMELFNSEESALSWLGKPCKPLCDVKPIDLLSTDSEKVLDIIYRIKTGDMS
jgi:uncharacterized protein (DUF2384 family)